MRSTKLLIIVTFLFYLLMPSTEVARGANVDLILREVSSGNGVGKVEIDGEDFELKVAGLAPAKEFNIELRGSFSQDPVILGRFLTGTKGEAKFSTKVTHMDLSLVEVVEVSLAGEDSGTIILRGTIR